MSLILNKKTYILFFFFFCFTISLYSQKDTVVNIDYIRKFFNDLKSETDTAIIFKECREIVDLTKKSNNQDLTILAYIEFSEIYENLREYYKAKDLLEEVLQFSYIEKNPNKLFKAKFNLARVERKLMNYNASANVALSALEYCEKNNLMKEKADLLYLISEIYYFKNLYDPSKKYSDDAKIIYKSLDDSIGLFHIENQYGLLHYIQSEVDSAFYYFTKASKIADKLQYENGIAISSGNLATINFELGKYEKYLPLMEKSVSMHKKLNNTEMLSTAYNNIGYFYLFKGQYDKSITNLERSVRLAKKSKFDIRLVQAYGNLGEVYDAIKDFKKAYVYRDSAANLEKLINELNGKRILAEMTGKYELEKKELQLENLNKENSLKEAEIEKSEIQRKNQIIIIRFFIAFIIIVLIFFLFLFRLFRQKNMINKQLKNQNIKIGLQNKQLIDANDEIKNQSEELKQLNENISNKNLSLNKSIKELKKTQSQLIQSEKMASLGVLAAGVGHEINNPLNFIKGGIDLMQAFLENKDKTIINDTKQYSEIIYEGINRASAIVKSLSLFSRQTTSMDEECNVHNIIDNCLTILYTRTKHKIDIIKNYHKTPIILKGNTGKLHQVFINILSNSEQAIESHGTISIKTEIVSDFYEITISDSGCGIDEKTLSKIGDPFFTTKDPGIGTGLGLSIAFSIIEEHKGHIKVHSKINEGAAFIVSLPKHENK